jgi:hypothetical protein
MNNKIDTSKAEGIYFKKTGESWEYHPKIGDKFSQDGKEVTDGDTIKALDRITDKAGMK